MLGAGGIFCKLTFENVDEKLLNQLFWGSLFINLIAGFAFPLTSGDLFSNLAYGQMIHQGLDPYLAGPETLGAGDLYRAQVIPGWLSSPMVYGPLVGWINWIAVLPQSLWGSLILHKGIYLLFAFITVGLVYLFCKNHLTGPNQTRGFILFALNPIFIWEISAQSHNDGIMVLATLGFVYLATEKYYWWALISLTAAFFAKFSVLPVLGLYLCFMFYQNFRKALLMTLTLILLTAFFMLKFSDNFYSLVNLIFNREMDTFRITNSLSYLIYYFLSSEGGSLQIIALKVFGIISWVGMGILGIWFALRAKTLDQVFHDSHIFLLILFLVAYPAFQPWYITWLLPFVITLKKKRFQYLFALYSVGFLLAYPVSTRIFGSLINLICLFIFLLYLGYGRKEGIVSDYMDKFFSLWAKKA